MGQSIRKWGALVQARAVRNVTGYPVVYEGGVFRVKVAPARCAARSSCSGPTGPCCGPRVRQRHLHRDDDGPAATRAPNRSPTTPAAIELGHKAIDLKQFMMGKIVPFFGARSQSARGPYAATGLEPLDPAQKATGRVAERAAQPRLQAKSKGPMTFTKKGGNAAYTGAKKGASTTSSRFAASATPAGSSPRPSRGRSCAPRWRAPLDQGRRCWSRTSRPIFDPRT
jgi:hypothetical protein